MRFGDAKPLAYVSDGSGLYEVVKGPIIERPGGIMAAPKRHVLIEDCRLEGPLIRLDEGDMSKWELVKPAPEPNVPDHAEEIVQ